MPLPLPTVKLRWVNLTKPQRVMAAVNKAHKRYLFTAGGHAKTTMKRLIRPGGKKKKASSPGQPPRSQTKILRKSISFNVVRDLRVDVGPATGFGNQATNPPAPEVLEFGGTATIKSRRRGKTGNREVTTQQIEIEPRPWVEKGLRKSEDRFPEFWKDTVTG